MPESRKKFDQEFKSSAMTLRRGEVLGPRWVDVALDSETVAQRCSYRQNQQDERKLWRTDYEDQGLVVGKENGEPIHPHTFSQSSERIINRPVGVVSRGTRWYRFVRVVVHKSC